MSAVFVMSQRDGKKNCVFSTTFTVKHPLKRINFVLSVSEFLILPEVAHSPQLVQLKTMSDIQHAVKLVSGQPCLLRLFPARALRIAAAYLCVRNTVFVSVRAHAR